MQTTVPTSPLKEISKESPISTSSSLGTLKCEDGKTYEIFAFQNTEEASLAISQFISDMQQENSFHPLSFQVNWVTPEEIALFVEIEAISTFLSENKNEKEEIESKEKQPVKNAPSLGTISSSKEIQKSNKPKKTEPVKESFFRAPLTKVQKFASLFSLAKATSRSHVSPFQKNERTKEPSSLPAGSSFLSSAEKKELDLLKVSKDKPDEQKKGKQNQNEQDEQKKGKERGIFSLQQNTLSKSSKKGFGISASAPVSGAKRASPPRASTPVSSSSSSEKAGKAIESIDSLYIRFMALMARILSQAEAEAHELYQKIKQRTDDVDVLTTFISKINSAKGKIDWSKDEEMKLLIEKVRALGVDIPANKFTWSEEEKKLLKENVSMRKDSLEKITQLERTDMQRFLQEASQCHQTRSNLLKLLKEVMDTIIANLRP